MNYRFQHNRVVDKALNLAVICSLSFLIYSIVQVQKPEARVPLESQYPVVTLQKMTQKELPNYPEVNPVSIPVHQSPVPAAASPAGSTSVDIDQPRTSSAPAAQGRSGAASLWLLKKHIGSRFINFF